MYLHDQLNVYKFQQAIRQHTPTHRRNFRTISTNNSKALWGDYERHEADRTTLDARFFQAGILIKSTAFYIIQETLHKPEYVSLLFRIICANDHFTAAEIIGENFPRLLSINSFIFSIGQFLPSNPHRSIDITSIDVLRRFFFFRKIGLDTDSLPFS